MRPECGSDMKVRKMKALQEPVTCRKKAQKQYPDACCQNDRMPATQMWPANRQNASRKGKVG